MTKAEEGDVRRELRAAYDELAEGEAGGMGCCPRGSARPDRSAGNGVEGDPQDSVGPGLGCGDPVALARLRAGQTVLDLGSGAGLDCFRAAEQVGEGGRVIGVDMTPGMIARARANQARIGVSNVDFRLAEIEHLPVADDSVDVVISNCVMNLTADKDQAFGEAYRVLKPGGSLAICDMLLDAPFPETLLEALPVGGTGLEGTLHEAEYIAAIERSGFIDVRIAREYVGPVHQEGAPGESGARMVVKIGETGDTLGSLELGADVDLATVPRSFNGRITATKPAQA